MNGLELKGGKKTLFHPVIKIYSPGEVSATLSAPPVPLTNIVPCPNYCITNSPLVFLLPHVIKCNTQNNL